MPTFWIALVALYVGFFKLGWFPGTNGSTRGYSRRPQDRAVHHRRLLAGQWGLFVQALHHLVLPALVLSVGLLTRYTRSAVLKVGRRQ